MSTKSLLLGNSLLEGTSIQGHSIAQSSKPALFSLMVIAIIAVIVLITLHFTLPNGLNNIIQSVMGNPIMKPIVIQVATAAAAGLATFIVFKIKQTKRKLDLNHSLANDSQIIKHQQQVKLLKGEINSLSSEVQNLKSSSQGLLIQASELALKSTRFSNYLNSVVNNKIPAADATSFNKRYKELKTSFNLYAKSEDLTTAQKLLEMQTYAIEERRLEIHKASLQAEIKDLRQQDTSSSPANYLKTLLTLDETILGFDLDKPITGMSPEDINSCLDSFKSRQETETTISSNKLAAMKKLELEQIKGRLSTVKIQRLTCEQKALTHKLSSLCYETANLKMQLKYESKLNIEAGLKQKMLKADIKNLTSSLEAIKSKLALVSKEIVTTSSENGVWSSKMAVNLLEVNSHTEKQRAAVKLLGLEHRKPLSSNPTEDHIDGPTNLTPPSTASDSIPQTVLSSLKLKLSQSKEQRDLLRQETVELRESLQTNLKIKAQERAQAQQTTEALYSDLEELLQSKEEVFVQSGKASAFRKQLLN